MQVFSALQVLVLFISFAFSHGKIEDLSKNIVPKAASQDIDPASALAEDSSDAIRKKKSASTTTLCVEIRPSSPYQRPFQVCEPTESKPYTPAAPAQSYYAAPTYEEVKPVASATPKPAPAYEAPAKTYSAKPTAAPAYASSKPYAAHSPSSYSSVSYRSEDGVADMMEGTEDDEHSEEVVEHLMRSSGGEYSTPYGLPVTYIQPAHKHKHKKGHNGLVITCQPSLAGYAATIPNYGGGYGSSSYGGYRASTGRSYNRYERPSPPKAPQAYASYSAPAPASSYKAPAPVYKAPAPSYPSYRPPAPSYSPPAYSGPAPAPAPAPIYRPAPAYRPAPTYSAPSYSPPAQTYSPPPPAYKPPVHSPPPPPPVYSAPAPQPAYKPMYAPAPMYSPPPQTYSAPPAAYKPSPPPYSFPAAPSYAAAPPPLPPQVPSYAPLPKPHPQPAYTAPSSYRDADESVHHPVDITTQVPLTQEEKEKHTIHKMTQIAANRSTGIKNEHDEGRVKMGEPGWAQVEGTESKSTSTVGEIEERDSWNQQGAKSGVSDGVEENKV
ncbi:hypothetical protein BDFB_006448 [Asbolus verrucosus]|uniref:Extensin n=1 Tax=Asbolus verrucosus TaxID=1661398 RepID=A0A482VZL1_ASBVE|nr:hypothetical protein BDFB_006448 [Asbolus verrucosus]